MTHAVEVVGSPIPLPMAGELTFGGGNPLILIPLRNKVFLRCSDDSPPISKSMSSTALSLVKRLLKPVGADRALKLRASIEAPPDLPKLLIEAGAAACLIKAFDIDLEEISSRIQGLMQIAGKRAFLLLSLTTCSLLEDSIACRADEGFITLEAVPPKLWAFLVKLRGYPFSLSSDHLNQLLIHALGHLSIEVANAIRAGDTEILIRLINMESFIIQALTPPPPSVQLTLANLSKLAPAVKPLIPLKRIVAVSSQKPSLPPRFKASPILEV